MRAFGDAGLLELPDGGALNPTRRAMILIHDLKFLKRHVALLRSLLA